MPKLQLNNFNQVENNYLLPIVNLTIEAQRQSNQSLSPKYKRLDYGQSSIKRKTQYSYGQLQHISSFTFDQHLLKQCYNQKVMEDINDMLIISDIKNKAFEGQFIQKDKNQGQQLLSQLKPQLLQYNIQYRHQNQKNYQIYQIQNLQDYCSLQKGIFDKYQKKWEAYTIKQKMYSNRNRKVILQQNQQQITKTPYFSHIPKNKNYSITMMKLYQQNYINFNEKLYKFIENILEEDQSECLFSQCLKGQNNKITKQKIKNLNKWISINKQSNVIHKFVSRLKLFKLNQIPQQMIPLSSQELHIINIIHPNISFQKIFQPKQTLYQEIIQQYLKLQNLQIEEIIIDDNKINISNPRNLLNILLYLNQRFHFQISSLLQTYSTVMVKYGYLNIVQKIIFHQNVFQICGVDCSMIQNIVFKSLQQILGKSFETIDFYYIQNIIEILPQNLFSLSVKKNTYFTIRYLTDKRCSYSLKQLLRIGQKKNILQFVSNLISSNSSQKLNQIDICMIYKKIWESQKMQKLQYYTLQLIELCKILSQKLMKEKFIIPALNILKPISTEVKKVFIAQLLLNYYNGCFLNRLILLDLHEFPLQKIFPEIKQYSLQQSKKQFFLKADKLSINKKSQWLNCQWEIFQKIYNQVFKSQKYPQQLKYIIFYDYKLASELSQSNTINQLKYIQFLQKVKSLQILNFQQQQQFNEQCRQFSQIQNAQLGTNSMRNINIENYQVKQIHLFKGLKSKSSESQKNHFKEINQFYNLQNIVGKDNIIKQLKSIYLKNPKQKFIIATQIVSTKVQLYHIEKYKVLISLPINYNFQSIISFDIFLTQQPQDCLQIIKSYLIAEITITNFWVIHLILNLMFKNTQTLLAQFLIEKIIKYEKNDVNAQIICWILNYQGFNFDISFLELMQLQAFDHGLSQIEQIIHNYLSSNY